MQHQCFRLTLVIIFLFLSIATFAQEIQREGAVATGHPLATQAGLKVLEKGGNAFDAAVAVAATLNVVEPAMSGLGGYGTTLIYDAQKQEIRFLNSSGRFPAKADSDFMREGAADYLKNRYGPKSISTPGNLNAWQEMHSTYGKMAWSSLFESAIFYAKTGFALSPYIAKLIAASFAEFSDYAKSFYGKDGHPLKEGEWLVQKDLGKAYELIAAKGAEPFYQGEIALLIDKQLKELGSFLSIDDLRSDVAEWWEPIVLHYKGYDIYTMGTPGNGFSALFTLGVMEQFPPEKWKHNSPEYLHVLAEVLKKSCKVRLTHSGCIEERSHIVDTILSTENFVSVAHSIDMAVASCFDAHPGKEGNNTTHFVVVDRWGNIVCSTQTLGQGFGSKVMIEGTGIWMNNSLAFSTFEPKGNPMDVFPGRYKLSSNSPIIIMKNNVPWAALGTPGGHTIPQNVAQIIINLLNFNMSMQEAIDAPKLAFFENKRVICTESGIPESCISALKSKGHTVDNDNIKSYVGPNGKIGNAMGVKISPTVGGMAFDIGIDRRRDGWSTTPTLYR